MSRQVTNIILSGVGGQGVLVASQILSETALAAGYDVKKAEVHGMSQRGGSVISHVRFGKEVFSPLISRGEADIILAFEPLEALRYLHYLRPGAIIVLNEERVLPQPVHVGDAEYPEDIVETCLQVAGEVIATNATHAAEQLGNRRVTNVLMLGMLSHYLSLPEPYWLAAIKKRVPPKSLELNQRAFLHGQDLVKSENATAKAEEMEK